MGTVLGWFLAFVFLGKLTRIVLLVMAFVGPFYFPRAEFTPSAEAAAVSTLWKTANALDDYRQEHPVEGYPATLPKIQPKCWARNVYEFRYSREISVGSRTVGRFALVAIPIVDRGLRSFALTEDGILHVADPNLHRPANRTDKALQ